MMQETENVLLTNKHILLCSDDYEKNFRLYIEEFTYVKNNFCGNVFLNSNDFNQYDCKSNEIIYLCGAIEQIFKRSQFKENQLINVIKEFSVNFDEKSKLIKVIDAGKAPLNIHNVGVYFRSFFDPCQNYFNLISNEHEFQTLTESNKTSNAFRTGIYLSKVEENENENEVKFNLLRCSSNLGGSTDNFSKTDNNIIGLVNNVAKQFFEQPTELNHVLAQIYENKVVEGVEKKAKISEHSDKTKDMPRNGLIAFCTFYKDYSNNRFDKNSNVACSQPPKSRGGTYDYYSINGTSVFTKLRFRLKTKDSNINLVDKFDVILYPNSVFLISLSTNRLYTHAIVPPDLPIHRFPTRLGYVIRCSKTNAIFKNGETHIIDNDTHKYITLEKPTEDGIKRLKELYVKENRSDEIITYGNFYFSLNNGDYEKPTFF